MKTKLAKLIALTALTISAGQAFAETDANRFTISFISDAAQGRILSHEKYAAAIERLQRTRVGGINGFFAANNLCVAYLKTGDLDSAEKTCTKAVDQIQSIRRSNKRTGYHAFIGNNYDTLRAIALSNRGVLYAVNDELDMARDAFNAALDIESGIRQPKINLARLTEIANPES